MDNVYAVDDIHRGQSMDNGGQSIDSNWVKVIIGFIGRID